MELGECLVSKEELPGAQEQNGAEAKLADYPALGRALGLNSRNPVERALVCAALEVRAVSSWAAVLPEVSSSEQASSEPRE